MSKKKNMSGYQKLKLKMKELEEQRDYLLQSNRKLVNEMVINGEHLENQPFIPEYLDFIETELEDKTTLVTFQRIYSKNGFNMSRMKDNWWTIITPDRKQNTLKIENMLEGINALKMSGMDITPKGIMDQKIVTRQVEQKVNEILGNTLQEFGEQEKIE